MPSPFAILYVENDPLVRDALADLIREHGFEVLTADDGREAMRLLLDHHVDLLLTDILMPGLDGIELAQQAKLHRPDLHILYMTGRPDQLPELEAQYGKVLRKPIRASAIIAEIRSLLGE